MINTRQNKPYIDIKTQIIARHTKILINIINDLMKKCRFFVDMRTACSAAGIRRAVGTGRRAGVPRYNLTLSQIPSRTRRACAMLLSLRGTYLILFLPGYS